ncbi:citrate synthase, mitochondrial-like [Corticium candelabrum]|uniref:citrate synthase, mitochondrial-like n=1 Tax=Corticium candelabrum TaxID=121492 RepID=UPI002E267037|nr:citrate synthase, mitochondrial-like [Corticium candelabrum]
MAVLQSLNVCSRLLRTHRIQWISRLSSSLSLRETLERIISEKQEEVKSFRAASKEKVIGQITVDQLYGGMRGMKAMLCETSVLDPDEGIRFRGYSIPECQKLLPKS